MLRSCDCFKSYITGWGTGLLSGQSYIYSKLSEEELISRGDHHMMDRPYAHNHSTGTIRISEKDFSSHFVDPLLREEKINLLLS